MDTFNTSGQHLLGVWACKGVALQSWGMWMNGVLARACIARRDLSLRTGVHATGQHEARYNELPMLTVERACRLINVRKEHSCTAALEET